MTAAHNNINKLVDGELGVSLIEVLIALVVFSLGVVGIAGLQLRTLGMTMDSAQRTYVVSKSQDIADKIRGSGVPPASYLGLGTPYNTDGNFCADNKALKKCADTESNDLVGACTVAQMAIYNLFDAFCEPVCDPTLEVCTGNGSLDSQVTDWRMDISCAAPNAAGVMTNTTTCNEVGATVTVTTTWYARSAIPDDSATATTGTGTTPTSVAEQDSMSLSFIP